MSSLTRPAAETRAGTTEAAPRRRATGSARIGASMFAAGAAVTAVAMVAPHSAHTDVAGFWWLFAAQALAAMLLLTLPRAFGAAWVPGVIVAFSIATISAAVYFNGERDGGAATLNELYYVWPALYVGYFFRCRGVVVSVAAIALAYLVVLGTLDTDRQAAVTRWMVTVSVAGGAAAALYAIRRKVDRLLRRLRDLAHTDPLTGLPNRRAFEERFEVELDRSRRSGEPLSLAVGDIDFFKRLNDAHGHAVGDRALEAVGEAISRWTRSTDISARIGGEEFAMLLPATSTSEAETAIERLRRRIGEIPTVADRSLTVSFGLVAFPEHGEAMGDLMHSADVALYRAKALGRDRTVIGNPDAPGTAAEFPGAIAASLPAPAAGA